MPTHTLKMPPGYANGHATRVNGVHPQRLAAKTTDDDAELAKAVRQTARMRQAFYVVVLLVALGGQVSGATEAFGLPLVTVIPAVAALELGAIVVLANADVRRRLGERAIGSRILSAVIAAGSVAFQMAAHADALLGAFFAGFSALGYCVWLTHTENQRRDRLRARRQLPPVTPAYEIWSHWVRQPRLTAEARTLAKRDPNLGLYGSLDAARRARSDAARQRAIARVLHQEMRSRSDTVAARIAPHVYDVDAIAVRLRDAADYDGLTALVQARLTPNALVSDGEVRVSGAPGNAPETHPESAPQAGMDAAAEAQLDAPGERTTDASDGAFEASSADAISVVPARRSGAPAKRTSGRTPRVAGAHSDGAKVARLKRIAADKDGRVSERTVMNELHVGRPEAKRLLGLAGLGSNDPSIGA